jgi:hypothetical protein
MTLHKKGGLKMKRGVIILVVLAMAFPLHCLAGEQLKSYHNVPEILLLTDLPFVAEIEITGKKLGYMAIQKEGKPEITFFAKGKTSETFSVPLYFYNWLESNSMLIVAADQKGNITTLEVETELSLNCPGCDLACYELDDRGYYDCSYFHHIDFSYANLSGASLRGQHVAENDFSYANLVGTDFSSDLPELYTNLNRCEFVGADLRYANFKGTGLASIDFTDANLTGADLTEAFEIINCVWNNTTCPDDTNSDANGGTCLGHL